jgi:hypothetical protein
MAAALAVAALMPGLDPVFAAIVAPIHAVFLAVMPLFHAIGGLVVVRVAHAVLPTVIPVVFAVFLAVVPPFHPIGTAATGTAAMAGLAKAGHGHRQPQDQRYELFHGSLFREIGVLKLVLGLGQIV